MCVQAQCTSPTEAHDHAGTLCPTSLAQMVAEGLSGGGDNCFCLIFLPIFFNILCRMYVLCLFLVSI